MAVVRRVAEYMMFRVSMQNFNKQFRQTKGRNKELRIYSVSLWLSSPSKIEIKTRIFGTRLGPVLKRKSKGNVFIELFWSRKPNCFHI